MSNEARYKRLLNSEVSPVAVLTQAQFKNLLVEARSRRYGEQNVSLVWHSFGSALRVTEIAQLKVGDVLARDGSIRRTGWLPATYTKNAYDKHPSGETEEYWDCSSLQQLLTNLIVSVGVINGSSHSGR